MRTEDLIVEINKSVEELDFATARKYIEENLDYLNNNKLLLKSNARDILKFLSDLKNSGYQPITRTEMAAISAINSYATKFDVRGIKMLVKDKAQLLLREDILSHLNTDAKIILEGMGAIVKK